MRTLKPTSIVQVLTPVGATTVATSLALIVAVMAMRARVRAARGRRWQDGARWVQILPGPDVDSDGASTLWANLMGLLRPPLARLFSGQPPLAFEYLWDVDGVRVGIWVPGPVPPGLVEAAVRAAYPTALTRTLPIPPPLGAASHDPASAVTGGRMRLARGHVLPLSTDHRNDPARPLLSAASGLASGESVCAQVVARPVTGTVVARARRATRRPDQPGAATASLLGTAFRLAGDLLTLLAREVLGLVTPGRSSHTGPTRSGGRSDHDPALASRTRAAVVKTSGPLWQAEVRYAVAVRAGSEGKDDDERIAVARGRAHAVASAFAVHAGLNWLARRPLPIPARALTGRQLTGGDLFSVPELAALAHLPWDPDAPGLERAGARAVSPAPAVPSPGAGVRPLGLAPTAAGRPVGLGVVEGRHHLHLLGATGSGKSTLIARMILDDVAHGRGAIVIDPKGDTVTDILDRLPPGVEDRLVLLDPAADATSVSLDLFTPPAVSGGRGDPAAVRRGQDAAVDFVVGTFARLYAGFWGPRTEDILRASCLTLLRSQALADEGASGPTVSLADVPRLLDDDPWRAQITSGLGASLGGGDRQGQVLARFWQWYDRLSPAAQSASTGPVLNKLRAVLLRDAVADLLTPDPATRIDFSAVLDGGLLLARLPAADLGPDTAQLLGTLVLAQAWQAATARVAVPGAARRDACIAIDECHQFLHLPYPMADMLAQARGLHVNLTLAHQNLTQLPRDLRDAISANARNKIYFAASPEDARDLAAHVHPRLSAHDLAHLGSFTAAARLMHGARTTPAFTLTTQPLPPPVPGRARALRRAQRRPAGPRSVGRVHLPGRSVVPADPRST